MNGQLCGGLCFALLDKTFKEYAEKIDVSEENCLTGFDLVDKQNFISSKLNESGVGEVVTTSERNIACGDFKTLGDHGWQWVDDWSECAMIIWTDYDANPFHQMYSDKAFPSLKILVISLVKLPGASLADNKKRKEIKNEIRTGRINDFWRNNRHY